MPRDFQNRPLDPSMGSSVHDVADYIIQRMNEAGYINVLKLHKLLYYVQAWGLAFNNRRCFDNNFQAWVHGPVNRETYDRFKQTKAMYSRLRLADMQPNFNPERIPEEVRLHINSVLEAYGEFADDQLEQMTHQERPWLEAREGFSANQRCDRPLSDTTMRDFYAQRLDS